MYQVALPIWNAIAASQPVSPMLAPAFRATSLDQLQQALDKLVPAGLDAKTSRALLTVGPLLAENESISAWMEESDRGDLRQAIPELTSTSEATALAQQEFNLSPTQEQRLKTALSEFVASANGAKHSAQPTA